MDKRISKKHVYLLKRANKNSKSMGGIKNIYANCNMYFLHCNILIFAQLKYTIN